MGSFLQDLTHRLFSERLLVRLSYSLKYVGLLDSLGFRQRELFNLEGRPLDINIISRSLYSNVITPDGSPFSKLNLQPSILRIQHQMVLRVEQKEFSICVILSSMLFFSRMQRNRKKVKAILTQLISIVRRLNGWFSRRRNRNINQNRIMKAVEADIEIEYDCIQKLGSGAFGHLILVRSKLKNEEYACKIEKNHGKKVVLVEKEFKMLADLMGTKQFPEVYSFKILEQHSYMIMEKLDSNLDYLFKKNNKKFSLKTIALISHEMMIAMKALHAHSYLHRDIKPENIMTSCNSHHIKLIDFGLAAPVFAKQSIALIGNVRFCSRRAHFGHSGKKEDLESLIYVIYYFLIKELPWQEATEEDIKFQINRNINEPENGRSFILDKKDRFLELIPYPKTHNEVHLAFFNELHEMAKLVHQLDSDDEINYEDLVHRTERLMCIIGVEEGQCYDWCQQKCPFKKSYDDYWEVLS